MYEESLVYAQLLFGNKRLALIFVKELNKVAALVHQREFLWLDVRTSAVLLKHCQAGSRLKRAVCHVPCARRLYSIMLPHSI
jgi:hypothetical protein